MASAEFRVPSAECRVPSRQAAQGFAGLDRFAFGFQDFRQDAVVRKIGTLPDSVMADVNNALKASLEIT